MMLFMENRSDQQQLQYKISVFQKVIQDHINVEIDTNLVTVKIINEYLGKRVLNKIIIIDNIKIGHLNAQSINNKIEELNAILAQTNLTCSPSMKLAFTVK